MKKAEFVALLKIQGLRLLMCEVNRAVHTHEEKMYAADVVTSRWNVVTEGEPAKTPAAAVQKTIARHYKQYANH